jgi:hypothetical protein
MVLTKNFFKFFIEIPADNIFVHYTPNSMWYSHSNIHTARDIMMGRYRKGPQEGGGGGETLQKKRHANK